MFSPRLIQGDIGNSPNFSDGVNRHLLLRPFLKTMFSFLLNPPLAYFILRIVLGALFIVHGYPKLFKNFAGFAGWLESMGLKPGKFWALVAGVVEFFGGIFLVLGLWTQLAGLLIVVQMLVAMWKVKWGKVGLTDQGGWELDLIYLVAGVVLVLTGGGVYSLDHLWYPGWGG